jgi:hypothetical protein
MIYKTNFADTSVSVINANTCNGMVRLCTTRVALTIISALPHAGTVPQFNHAR